MNMMKNRLFYSFIFVIGSGLAVLGLFIGQLFPFYAGEYYTVTKDQNIVQMEQVLEDEQIELTEAQKKALTETYAVDSEAVEFMQLKMKLYFIIGINIIGRP